MSTEELAIRHGLELQEFVALFDAGRLSLGLSPQFSVALPASAGPPPADPLSNGYRDWVLRVWSAITGRPTYRADVDEAFGVTAEEFLRRPWPYSSGSASEVGLYRGAIAWLLRLVQPKPTERVVEFGAGWGLLSLELAMLGCSVSAVDLNLPSVTAIVPSISWTAAGAGFARAGG